MECFANAAYKIHIFLSSVCMDAVQIAVVHGTAGHMGSILGTETMLSDMNEADSRVRKSFRIG